MNKMLHWTFMALFVIGMVYFFLPTWSSLFARWNMTDGSYSHGYIVLIITIYYIFQNIRSFDTAKVKANYFVAPMLLASSLMWVLAFHAHIEVIHQILLPIIIGLFFVLVMGIEVGKKFLFPSLYLWIAIPFWDYLTEPLQTLTTFINSILLGFFGVTAYIDGFFVTIPSGAFEIAGGCSGLRYIVVALALAGLYAYQNYSRWTTTCALLLTAITFSLVANWLRVFIIIVVGHITEMESDLIENHDLFGWILFAITLIPFFYLAGRYSVWFGDEAATVEKVSDSKPRNYKFTPYLVAFLATFSLPLLITSNTSEADNGSIVPLFAGDRLHDSELWIHPVFSGADIVLDDLFAVDGRPLQVSLRTYDQQRPGKELVYYQNKTFSDNWLVSKKSSSDGWKLFSLEHKGERQKVLVASRYSVGGYHVSNHIHAKLLELFKPLMGSKSSSVLILAAPCEDSCTLALSRIESFATSNNELIDNL